MEVTSIEMWVAVVVLGVVPLAGWLLWWWNDIWYALQVKTSWRSDGSTTVLPPGHMGLPFLGEMLNFLWYFKVARKPDDFITTKRQKYGDGEGIYKTHLFGSPAIIACSPVINKFIFQSNSDFIMEWPAVELIGKSSLAAVQGAAHARLKSYISRAINQPEALRRFCLMMQPRIISALHSWAQIGRLSSYKQTKKVMFEIIGKSFVNFEPGNKLDLLDDLFTGLMQGIRSYPLDFPGTAYHHALKCRKKTVSIFAEELQKRRKGNEEEGIDLLSGLMKLKDEEGKLLSDDEVIDNILNLVVAGYETTSLTIMWCFYYLAKYPKVLQKLRDENIPLSKSKNGELITTGDISKLKYTNKVVEETIRMANVAVTVFRTATRDVEYKGYKIPKGWKVMLWVRYLHTNSENFDDPMCFNPDRWNVPAKPGTYQAFGGGSRMCAGNMLARLQVAIFLHYMSSGYKWELVNPEAETVYLSHPKPTDGVEILINKL